MSNEDVRLILPGSINYAAQKQTTANNSQLANAVVNGTGAPEYTPTVASDVSSSDGASTSNSTQKRTIQDIQRVFQNIIKNTNLTLDNLKEILDYGGLTYESLQELSDLEFDKTCGILRIAIAHEAKKGSNIDIKNLKLTLISCKIAAKDSEKPEDIEKFICEYENKDLLDIMQEKCPNLVNGKKLSELSPQELKEIFKTIILKRIGEGKTAKNPEAFMDYFMGALGRCDNEEKAKIFYAFALLLKDQEMQDIIPEAYKNLVKSYENNIEELKQLITKVGPELLKLLGFDNKMIQILNFEAIKTLSPEQLGAVLKNIMNALDQIDANDLPVIKKVLESISNNQLDTISEDELKVFSKYKGLFDSTITLIAEIANRPDLDPQLKEYYKQLIEKLSNLGLSDAVFAQVYTFFNENKDLFNNADENIFIKKINEISDNKFSEAIGDTNPANLYTPSSEDSGSYSGIGLGQRVSYETYQAALANRSESSLPDTDTAEDYVVIPNNDDKSEKPMGLQTVAEIKKGLAEGYYDMNQIISECTSNLNNAIGKVTVDFFNGLSSISSQINNLGKLHSFIAKGKIIDECNYDYAKMENKVVLTVGEKQEQEKKSEENDKIKGERPELT